MNPILASEGRRRMRSWRTPILLTVFGGLMLLFCYWFQLRPLTNSEISLYDMRAGVSGYTALVIVQFVLIVLVAPIMSAGSIAGERERQTLDLLLVTNTGSLRIVLGKLLESFAFLAILIIGVMPITCSALLYGSIDLQRICVSTLFMLVSAFAALSVGMLCSVLFKRTVTAAIVSYLLLLGIGLFTLVPLLFMNIDEALMESIIAGEAGMRTLLRLVPLSLWINPGLGLGTLIISQTGMLESIVQRGLPSGNQLMQIIDQLGIANFVWINMGAMLLMAILLVLASALFVRPRSGKRRRRAKKV